MSRLIPPEIEAGAKLPKPVDSIPYSRKEAKYHKLMRAADARRTEVFVVGRHRSKKRCLHEIKSWERDLRFERNGRPSNWWNLICAKCKKHVDYCMGWTRGCRCGNHPLNPGPRR